VNTAARFGTLLPWLPGLLSVAALPAQPVPVSPVSPVQALRSPDLTPAGARPLVEALLAQPIAVRLQGADALRTILLDRWRLHRKAAAATQVAVAKLVPAVHKRKLGAKGAARVELLREEAARISRDPALDKQRIHDQLDPRLGELRQLLLPSVTELIERDATLGPQLERLRQQRDELAAWRELYTVATAELELNALAQRHFTRVPPPPLPPNAAALDGELPTWILLALPLDGHDQRALRDNETLREQTAAEEFAGTAALNEIRFLLGLPLLRIDPKLGLAARDHSADMESLQFFDHTSPVAGKRSFTDRAGRFGTSASAENIAAGQATGAGAIQAWWYSPGHHRNMLGGHQRTGLGRSGALWTQLFGG
jgi:uncharacterized protein YkwD